MAQQKLKRKQAPSKPSPKRKAHPVEDKPTAKRVKTTPAGAAKQPPATEQPKKLLSHKEHKEAIKSKKLKFKKNYATIQATVLLWEQLRPKTTTDDERRKLVSLIINKISGQVLELSNHHSASRVIQWCLKYADAKDRARLLGEVRGAVVPLAKSKYGWHVVTKLINVASKEEVPDLLKLFKGHVAELLRHPHGADVLVDLYDVAPQAGRNAMCAELYGREFVLFDGVGTKGASIGHLKDLLATVPAAKQRSIIESLYKEMAPVLEKAILHPPMVHRLLRELLECAPSSLVADIIDTLAATGALLKLVHTHDGAAAAAMALAYGTPKDRKRFVKAMKTFVWKTAENEWGYGVVCTALARVDDTAITGKLICGEVKANLADYVTHQQAHHVLLQLLAPDNTRYFPPAMMELLHPPQRTIRATSAAATPGGDVSDEEVDADDEQQQKAEAASSAAAGGADVPSDAPMVVMGASKKDGVVRRKELLGSGGSSLSAALCADVASRVGELLGDPAGSHVAVEVARGAAGGVLWQLDQAGVAAVQQAIVEAVQQPRPSSSTAAADSKGRKQGQAADGEGPASSEHSQEHVMLGYYSSRALRQLILCSTDEVGGEGAQAFVQQLWQQAVKGQCSAWYGSHADKVLAALVQCGVPSVCEEAHKELQQLVGEDVLAWSGRFVMTQRRQQSGEEQHKPQQHQQPPTPQPAAKKPVRSKRTKGA